MASMARIFDACRGHALGMHLRDRYRVQCATTRVGRVPPVTTLARAAAVLRIAGIPYPCGRAVRTERSPRCIEAPKHRMTCFHKSAGDKLSRPLPRDPTLFCRHPYP